MIECMGCSCMKITNPMLGTLNFSAANGRSLAASYRHEFETDTGCEIAVVKATARGPNGPNAHFSFANLGGETSDARSLDLTHAQPKCPPSFFTPD
ncbi:hypothetical protein HaLaN_17953 [Haematococcus lacustris]|uniref:Uncharacterized protein n=1 Tax=Haematococcus lacustris TaxID=44745 RepID=A0A699ZFT0_HAELA|nr:hypothetical protein HaLaN_17953 [Haematococcus lacustris]